MTALEILWHCCAGAGNGFNLIRFSDPDDAWFVPIRARSIFQGLIAGQAEDREPEVGVIPMVEANNYRLRADHAHCLWARVESGESARRLAAFRPEPTIVLRDGATCKRTALWALHSPLELVWAHELCRRLQHRFAAPKKFAESSFAVHPPGVFLRLGRAKPVEIVVEHMSEALYGARQIAGHLPQSPDVNAWAKANGRYVP